MLNEIIVEIVTELDSWLRLLTHRVMLRHLQHDTGTLKCAGNQTGCTQYVTGYNPAPKPVECWAEWLCTNCARQLCPQTFVSMRNDQNGRNSLMIMDGSEADHETGS